MVLAGCGSDTGGGRGQPSSTTSTASTSASPDVSSAATPSATATAAIVVDSPRPGDIVHSPLLVTGTADTFEATFRISLVAADGQVLADQQVMATSGTGTRGSFSAHVAYSGTGSATLVAYEVSAKDGSHVNEVHVPLTLG